VLESSHMVCSNCTLLHPVGTEICCRCGTPLYGKLDRACAALSQRGPTALGVVSGASLLLCLTTGLMLPMIAAQMLAAGSYFGIISITNMWLSAYRAEVRDWLQGMRGFVFTAVLTVSLVGEIARLLGANTMQLPGIFGPDVLIQIPSALDMELIAAMLIVVDPLIVRPLLKWIADGEVRSDPAQPAEFVLSPAQFNNLIDGQTDGQVVAEDKSRLASDRSAPQASATSLSATIAANSSAK
jgi:hypothetical protein